MYFFKYLCWLMALSLAAMTATAHEIKMLVGDTKVLQLAQVSNVVVGDDYIVQVELLEPDDLVIKAMHVGHTELILRHQSGQFSTYSIHVTARPNETEHAELAWLRSTFPQLDIRTSDEFVQIRGELAGQSHQQVTRLAEKYPHWLVLITEAVPQLQAMIELHVRILEVKRQRAESLGVKWPNSITGPTVSDESSPWMTFPILLNSTINLLVQSGHAKVLAEPKLMAASGGQAEFLVGGEIPIPQLSAQGVPDVEFRDYGISLSMSPTDLGQGKISTLIQAKISTIDPATAVQGIPGMLTRRVSSLLTAESGEAIVLSGLFSQEQSQHSDLFPGLQRLPILGELFTSQDFRTAQTEFVVVVTPTLLSHKKQQRLAHQQAQMAIENFRRAINCVGLYDEL